VPRGLETVWQDLVFVWRSCRRQPAFAFTAIATLTLGIGANTAIFSLVNAALLRPAPYPDPDRIVMIGTESAVSPAKFDLWQTETASAAGLQELSAWRLGVVNVTGTAEPEEVAGAQVSARFFRLFGADISVGRGFDLDDDRPNAAQVVVLGHGFWLRHFGADAHVVGRSLTLNGVPHVIVGVLRETFDGETMLGPFAEAPQVWTPLQIDPQRLDQANNLLGAAARLGPGSSVTSVRTALQRAAMVFKRRYPGVMLPADEFGVEPLQAYLTGDVRTPLLVLSGAVCFVLLIACANVANLLLARATVRSREIAIRTAIGASRGRIVRQLLTESLVLATVSGVAGAIAGIVGVRALLVMSPAEMPRLASTTLDWRVLTFTAILSIATGLIFGLLPALHASRTDLIALASASASRGGRSRSSARAQAALVIAEMTLAVALLIGAALLIRTFVNLYRVDAGFDRQNVVTMRMSLREARFARTSAVAALTDAGVTQVSALPGVMAVSLSACLPIQGYLTLRFTIPSLPLSGAYHGMGSWGIVSPGYFDVFKIPLIRGRLFTARDTRGAPPVVIISEALARRFFPSPADDPLTHQIVLGRGLGKPFDEEVVRQIVGVVGDVRERDLTRALQPTTYVPIAQQPDGLTAMTSSLRTGPDARVPTHEIADALKKATNGVPVSHVRSMDEVMSIATARQSFNMVLLTIFAAAAALLAMVGVYGLMSYAINQRTPELAIRLALGADPGGVRRMMLRQGLRLAVIGTALGLAVSFALTRVLSRSLFDVSPHDPLVFASVPLLVLLIAGAAAWLPGRRVSRIDPVIALRRD
jgi:putative ABC transport system permease protein